MKHLPILLVATLLLIPNQLVIGQTLTRENMVFLTAAWTGDRYEDGRPKVPDEILERLKKVTIVQVWSVLKGEGFENQFVRGWDRIHPGEVMVGRVVTAAYMPERPDLKKQLLEKAEREGRHGAMIHWPINQLVEGDVYVADIYGKTDYGPVIGDRLGSLILEKSGNGVIMNGAVRDLEGLKELPKSFTSFYRTNHPTPDGEKILTGLNTPVRIDNVTVMPGDVVLGKDEGIIFIPPHLAEKVAVIAEIVELRDKYGQEKLREGKYTAGQIDGRWSQEIEADFILWVKNTGARLPVPEDELKTLLENRTW